MASLWKHPNSKYWTACYTDRDGKQVKRSTKQTKRAKALTIALEFERVEQQARQGAVSTLQLQEVFNDLAEKTTGDTIPTPSVEEFLKDWLPGLMWPRAVLTSAVGAVDDGGRCGERGRNAESAGRDNPFEVWLPF